VAAVTAAGVVTILDSLSLSDIIKTIESLRVLRGELRASVDRLQHVQPLFRTTVDGVMAMEATIADMRYALERMAERLDLGAQISLTEKDVEFIATGWATAREDAQTWLDVINRQGIQPIDFAA
jgi:hypothetical protein